MVYYTGIGSRKTPKEVLEAFEFLGAEFAKRGYILRSGGADGADDSFEKGCDSVGGKKEIFLPWRGFNGNTSPLYSFDNAAQSVAIAKKYHPYWENLSNGGRALMARNSYQVLGTDLHSPSAFIVCYTEGGKGEGGTGQALRIAKDLGIKVCDFGRFPKERALDYAKKVLQTIEKEISFIWEKERDIWYEFYTTFNDDNVIHADNAFYNNHLDNLSIEDLHAENINWVKEIIEHSLSPEQICEFMPSAAEYVKEVISENPIKNESEKEERE